MSVSAPPPPTDKLRRRRMAFLYELRALGAEEARALLADAVRSEDAEWFLRTRVSVLLKSIPGMGPQTIHFFLIRLDTVRNIEERQIRELTPREREALARGLYE